MKFKLLFIILNTSLIVFSSSNAFSSESKNYSPNKKKYMQSCLEASDRKFCSCQFDVVNPILSRRIGNNWVDGKMEEKDYDIYYSAIQKAVQECSN